MGDVVFWPSDLVATEGILVGWKMSRAFVLCSCLSVSCYVPVGDGRVKHISGQSIEVSDRKEILKKHGLEVLGSFGQESSDGALGTIGSFTKDESGLPRCAVAASIHESPVSHLTSAL
jgi:hypothetical protein